MFVKQIDLKTALELVAKDKEVMVLVPGEKEPKWETMMPDTLQHMLEGCLFFRKEPAMEKEVISPPQRRKQQETLGEGRRLIPGNCWPCIRPAGAMSRLQMRWASAM